FNPKKQVMNASTAWPALNGAAAAVPARVPRVVMARQPIDPDALDAEIARLPDLGIEELRRRWQELYGRPAPKTFRRNLLVRGVAYQMQVKVYGGLSNETKRRLREIALAVRNGGHNALIPGPRIKPGTQILRLWQGKTHTVLALADGFQWQGKTYRSLSAIAKAITGTQWNGYIFFGVKRRPAQNKNAAGPREARHD
ncbi:MAG: DUF2924 domain-containing protein, partial [Terriglobia bacterium]